MCIFIKTLPFCCINIHTSSRLSGKKDSPAPGKMTHFSLLSPPGRQMFSLRLSSTDTNIYSISVDDGHAFWLQMCSAVYSFHLHMINSYEISTDLLFTKHHWAAATRHTITTDTLPLRLFTATKTHPCSIATSMRASESAGEAEALCFLGAGVTLPSDHRWTHGV